MPRAEIQATRDALLVRVMDTRTVTRTAIRANRDALIAENVVAQSIHLARCYYNLDGVIAALAAGDITRATELMVPICAHSLDNWLAE